MQDETAGLSVGEAARLLGTSNQAVRKRIARGSLRAYKVDGIWRVIVPQAGQAARDTARTESVTIGEAVAQAARIQHLEGEVAFLRGLTEHQAGVIAELTRRVPELSAGDTPADPQSPVLFHTRDEATPSPGPSVTLVPRRGWLRRWLRL